MPKGGPDRGQGRKSKPPDQKHKRILVSLPPELAARLKGTNKSKLIQQLLTEYFERKEK